MSVRLRLFLASFLMLFLELSLIRWTGAEIVHLSYFSNFVLLGSFLGIGLGFLRAARPGRRPPLYSPVALLALVGFVSAYPVTVDRSSSSVIFFTSLATSGPPIWATLPIVFLSVAAIMAGPGELVADCFTHLPRLDAYRLDLLGSFAGVVVFTLCSFTGMPPLVWFTVVALLFAVLLGAAAASVTVTLVIATVAMFLYPLVHDDGVFWSPYYEVTTFPTDDGAGGTQWQVYVNGIPHQAAEDAQARLSQNPFYDEPYKRIVEQPRNVLIVGAGTGTDVAIALLHGVSHVDAVEIDPALLDFGKTHHPNQPYQDPRVTTHVNDGRAFLENTDKKYDLILFALPDSLTLVSGASALRLESYLFTEQAMEAARDHLAPGGAFSMYNYYRETWLVDRLGNTIDQAFGHAPCIQSDPAASALAVFVVGLTEADQQCDSVWVPSGEAPAPSTDDHPFLYVLDDSGLYGIPWLYVIALALILAASAVCVVVVGGVRQVRTMGRYGDLFCLGAAFLLLETKNVTGFALYFGTTWLVNAIVFGGVLLAVLAAVEITRRFPTPPLRTMYAVLWGGLALAWAVPTSWVLSLAFAPRLLVAVSLAFVPIMAANVIFAKRFATTTHPTTAFAANLLGAMVGGCLEYLALATGYRALLVVCAALYLGAFLLTPRDADATPRGARGGSGRLARSNVFRHRPTAAR
ncbi:MAG TPA: spermidine synthase [Nocardioidaceae bacterium]|nr:spermidine synthase [Nocardioidaceae bacterium]